VAFKQALELRAETPGAMSAARITAPFDAQDRQGGRWSAGLVRLIKL